MPNIQLWLNREEEQEICSTLECRYDKIGVVLKASILEKKHSPDYRDFKKSTINVEDVTDELKKQIVDKEKEKIIEQYLKETEGVFIMDRKAKIDSRPKMISMTKQNVYS